jgi:hypothetical protein
MRFVFGFFDIGMAIVWLGSTTTAPLTLGFILVRAALPFAYLPVRAVVFAVKLLEAKVVILYATNAFFGDAYGAPGKVCSALVLATRHRQQHDGKKNKQVQKLMVGTTEHGRFLEQVMVGDLHRTNSGEFVEYAFSILVARWGGDIGWV